MTTQARTMTLADAVFPKAGVLRNVLLVVGFAALTAISGQIRVYLPDTIVPITLQTFAVLITGAALGSRLGTLSLLTFLVVGAVGVPVFQGGHSGLAYMMGGTGGYLLGFLIASYIVGRLAERGWDRRHTTLAMLIGNIYIYIPGVLWLGLGGFYSWDKVLAKGLYPFIAGDLLKLALAAIVLPSAWALVNRVKK